MIASILETHEDSPIDLGKRQVFFINDHEFPQWPEPKMFGDMDKILVSTNHMY